MFNNMNAKIMFSFSRIITKIRPLYKSPSRSIYVLGIESSCDDSSAAVVDDSGNVLGESHFSQAKFHTQAGGIIPQLAFSFHNQHLKNVVDTSLKQSLLSVKDLNAIAVTVKPGLILSLTVGTEYAKDLCTLYSKPLIPIHHMEAHALTGRIVDNVKFPFLTLLISGGHCILALVKSVDTFYTLGTSLDDSPGQMLDQIAKRAKLKNSKKFSGLVGGAAIEAAAVGGDSSKFRFLTTTFRNQTRNCNFSFSGIRALCNTYLKNEETKNKLQPDEIIPNINDLCAGVLLTTARHLCQRLEIAFEYISQKNLLQDNEKCLILSGGVACNKFLRKAVKKVCDHHEYKLVVPPPKLCSDNGTMVAWNGIEILRENLPVIQPDALSSVAPTPCCPLGEDISDDVNEIGRQMTFKYHKLRSYSEIAAAEEI